MRCGAAVRRWVWMWMWMGVGGDGDGNDAERQGKRIEENAVRAVVGKSEERARIRHDSWLAAGVK